MSAGEFDYVEGVTEEGIAVKVRIKEGWWQFCGSGSGSGSGIRCLFDHLDPGSGMGEKSRSGSGMNILDHISESLETIFWVNILKFFDADADPGWEKFGSRMFIPDPQLS
jgi:hypothetical protein